MVGKGKYELGTGGRKPANATPFAASRKGKPGNVWCDCSGFVAWVLGYDRVQNLGLDTEFWLSCEGIIYDAHLDNEMFRMISINEPIMKGDIVVYGPKGKMKYGHIGVIVEVLPTFVRLSDDWGKGLRVAHCSTGNNGVAVRISDATLWQNSLKKKDSGSYILRYRHFAGE